MSVPEIVHRLVDRFHSNLDAYKSGNFDEAQVRVDFIDPLFGKALGWDIYNEKGYSEAYREVVYEDRIKISGRTKAPDYGFYIGDSLRFFLEAKKPSVHITTDVDPAVQLRRYAWTAKLPLSVVTDFEEFAVYDGRFAPRKDDGPTTARLELFTYEQYVDAEVWDKISSVFSRVAVRDGSLDKYAQATKQKRGTQTVGDAFLKEIESWRDMLARNLAVRNDLNQRQLNYAVQMTIDRIIFLRMAEDRGVEDYKRLLATLDGPNVYGRMCNLFRDADDRYNSGLFHFRQERNRAEEPDDLTLRLEIDDKVLKRIISGLYYPDCPYEFSVLPVDVLGQVYEQFLGKVIRLTESGHRAVVEEKPEVRKAGGVYYTPTYIVDYIVEHTVGKLLEGKRPGPKGGVSRLKIVDPACGSGSFLIRAYKYLLDWHRDRYVEDGPEKWPKQLYEGPGGQWHLTIDEKKRILLNNIYGVDIDSQAVEVTKLSLLLKVLEGETNETIESQLRLFAERALPDLDDNIKCGNSLIGPDFYDNPQLGFLDEEEHYRINVFNWEKSFPQIFSGENPGFDAVVGNPPYLNIRLLTQVQHKKVKDYFKSHYICAHRGYDLYVLFVERALWCLSERGHFGMIVPNKVATLDYAFKCRSLLLENTKINSIADVSTLNVFQGASVYPYIIAFEKTTPSRNHVISLLQADSVETLSNAAQKTQIEQDALSAEEGFTIHGTFDTESRVKTEPLSGVARIHSGTTGFGAQQMAEYLMEKVDYSGYDYLEFIVSGNIDRYSLRLGDVHFMKRRFDDPVLPNPESKLTTNKLDLYKGPKIVIAGMTKRLEATFNPGRLALGVQVYAAAQLSPDHRYLLGILNSKFLSHLFRLRFQAKHLAGGYLAINKGQLSKLPIRIIDFSDPDDQARHDRVVELVEHMLSLHEQMAEAKIESERTVVQHQIDATDRQIDRLVYELYGLTDEEIAIVEDATTS